MIRAVTKYDYKKTEKSLNDLKNLSIVDILSQYGELGVQALYEATPKRTGLTASSWKYEIVNNSNGSYSIFWKNDNVADDYAVIALLLDTGHATGRGTFVQGRHYISPAIQPIFDMICNGAWEEIKRK